MGQRTPLYDAHIRAGGKMVDFSGWDMPVHYGSQLEEHHVVRKAAGMFDVSHMTVVDLAGPDARTYLRYLLANDVDKLTSVGKALYSGLLNEQGGVLDDLIVYRGNEACTEYRVVVNCATREKDLDWLQQQAARFDVTISERPELAMLAIQGPKARQLAAGVVCDDAVAAIKTLKIFQGRAVGSWFIARTGYTGEDGLEIILPADDAEGFWNRLLDAGVGPCGLGARDTLRLEAGMNLYGQDMTESVTPLEANMGWTIAWEPADRDFIGRSALETQKAAGDHTKLFGLVLEGRGVLRAHQAVVLANGTRGETTSGTFSPTLQKAIALARLPGGSPGDSCEVEIRGKMLPARIVKPCFVRNGASQLD